MSSKDKTREKLLGSMRKSKADAGIDTPASPPRETQKPAAAKPAVRKKAASLPEKSTQGGSDAYQSGHRVWPD